MPDKEHRTVFAIMHRAEISARGMNIRQKNRSNIQAVLFSGISHSAKLTDIVYRTKNGRKCLELVLIINWEMRS